MGRNYMGQNYMGQNYIGQDEHSNKDDNKTTMSTIATMITLPGRCRAGRVCRITRPSQAPRVADLGGF